MFSPNLSAALKQFSKQTSIRRSLKLIDPMHDMDSMLRTAEVSVSECDPQLLGLASKAEARQEVSRNRFM